MSNAEYPSVTTLFGELDRWRHFAGYPFEARVDALMGLFLPKVIEDCCKVKSMNQQVIPQFPLKKPDNNQSYNVDYFALSNDGAHAFLIEIKTDMGSRSKRQYSYLRKASRKEMGSILSDVKEVASASSSRKKYFHLIHALSEMGLLCLPDKLKGKMSNQETRDSAKLIREIEVRKSPNPKPKVLYIQPVKDESSRQSDFEYIYFDDFAKSIKNYGELGGLLASYLKRWKTDPGSCPPVKA